MDKKNLIKRTMSLFQFHSKLIFFSLISSIQFQQTANVLLILTAALIGLLCYILGEAKHRRAFVEAKQSLEVKTLIEEQSAEQVSSLVLFIW